MEVSDPAERSWQIGISHGGDLTLCLYMRDRLGLTPDITPRIAALVPQVSQTPPLPESARPELEEQWVRWWYDRMRAHRDGRQPHFDDPANSFPELSSSWALYEFVTAHADDGRARVEAGKREFFEIFKSTRRYTNSFVELGNRYNVVPPFKLSITCLPVDDKQGWIIDPENALVSYRLYSDQKGFLSWLEETLASRSGR